MNSINMSILMLLCLFIQQDKCSIAIQEGDATLYLGEETNPCTLANNYQNVAITFAQTFDNIPKVLVFPYYLDQQICPDVTILLKVTVQLTTELGFFAETNFIFSCEFQIRFKWIAIDDYRIDIIPLKTEHYRQYNIVPSNPNVIHGFFATESLIAAQMSYLINIQSITAENIVIEIQPSTVKIRGFNSLYGYLVLGTPEAFSVSQSITKTSLSPYNTYNSGTIQKGIGKILFLPIEGLTFSSNLNLRLQGNIQQTDTTAQYQFSSWTVESNGWIESLSWREVLLNTQNTRVLYPMFFKKMRISKGIFFNQGSSVKLEITELNKVYTAVTSVTLLIQKPIQTLTVVITFKCTSGNKVSGLFQSRFQTIRMNKIAFYITLYQVEQVNQSIDVNVTPSGFLMTQTVFNQKKIIYNIIKLDLISQ